MRVVLFFVFLFSHLLSKGSDLRTGTHHAPIPHHHSVNSCSHHRLAKSESFSFATADLDMTEIEEAEVDEEHFNGDDVSNSLVNQAYLLCDKWYLSFFPSLIPEDDHKRFKSFPPFCADSAPIYIRQRVLKI
ncbi:hypothetical protein SAMN05421820_101731 [Pedobacter steynii]|uniref:Uncharacterized protein n=1 Tax=Pedobacter steynii TaxID=430522 RepID=A0A1G9L123_9SPHI|nr:hypothetical protein [Pedobacter steynii]NQX38700.1 hypothetical protein [Pedobacter steynii]SDL55770.1 hypothetical protein SAMN05421820_101731 [Pedobacter steynii]